MEIDVYQGVRETIPTDVKTSIEEWFDDRRVCSNEKFQLFFRRILNRDYGTFKEKLRIEPGFAKYDWTVERYHELQTYQEDEKSDTRLSGTQGTEATQRSTEAEKKDTGRVLSGKISAAVGEDEKKKTDAQQGMSSGVENGATEGRDGTTETKSSGTETFFDGQNKTTVETESESGARSVAKSGPQSISYPNFSQEPQDGAPDMVGWHVPRMDWKYPGSQAQDRSRTKGGTTTTDKPGVKTTVKGLGEFFPDISETDRTGKTRSNSAGVFREDGEGTEEGKTSGQTSESGSEIKDSQSTEAGGDTSISSRGSTTREEGSGGGKSLQQTVETGRERSLAALLEEATRFIEGTTAMEWLLFRLEPCFLGIY